MAAPSGERVSLLLPLSVTAPGGFGITEETSMAGEDSRWLFEAQNAVYNSEGLIGPRQLFKRWTNILNITDVGTNPFYPTYAGSGYFVSVNQKICNLSGQNILAAPFSFLLEDGLVAYTSPTTTKHWKAVYMKNNNPAKSGWFLFAAGEIPKWTDGSFFTMNMPNGPTHGIAHVAFGRIWTSNGTSGSAQTLQWSQLLNGRDWTTAGTGDIDLSAYISQNEIVTAIADFNNFLVVFTNRSILIFDNPFNVGIDTAGALTTTGTMSLKEKIDGTGCVGMNAWTNIGEELFFLSYGGLYRMSRIIASGGSNPLEVVCPQINKTLINSMKSFAFITQNMDGIRLNYHPMLGAISLETGHAIHGLYMIWITKPIGNNSYAVTQWCNKSKSDIAAETSADRKYRNTEIYGLYSGMGSGGISRGLVGVMRQYNDQGQLDGYSGGVVYDPPNFGPLSQPQAEEGFFFKITSSWLNFGDATAGPQEKIPKDLKMIYHKPRGPYTPGNPIAWAGYVPTDLPCRFILRYDFDEITKHSHDFIATNDNNFDPNGYKSLYHSEIEITPVPLSGSGNLVQWELRATIDNLSHQSFSVQRAGFQTKLGRINQGI